MTTNRKQHYVPRTYLSGFAESFLRDGRLFAHDLVIGKSFPSSPGQIGRETDFYRDLWDVDGPGLLDRVLSYNENLVAPVLDRVRTREELPSRDTADWAHLIHFVSLSAIRSPSTRKLAGEIWLRVTKPLLEDPTITEEDWRSLDDHPPTDPDDLAVHELLVALRDGRELTVEQRASLHWQGAERIGRTLPPVLYDRRWHLGRATDAEFVTCDAPVLLEPTKRDSALGFATDDCNVVMPLSPGLVLVGQPMGRDGGERLVWPRRVETINGLAVMAAQRHVVSRSVDYRWRDDLGTRLRASDALRLGHHHRHARP